MKSVEELVVGVLSRPGSMGAAMLSQVSAELGATG